MDYFITDSLPPWMGKTLLVLIVAGLFMVIAVNL